jgi:hypothetical protein
MEEGNYALLLGTAPYQRKATKCGQANQSLS